MGREILPELIPGSNGPGTDSTLKGSHIVLMANAVSTVGLARIFREPDRPWRKAFQSEAVVIYCEG